MDDAEAAVLSHGNGQAGFGNGRRSERETSLTPLRVQGLANVTALVGAPLGRHFIALLKDGTIRIWGNTDWGQGGVGIAGTEQATPAAPKISGVKAVFAAGNSSFAIREDNSAWIWGAGYKWPEGPEWPLAANAKTPVPLTFWPWVLLGSGAQIVATALMLATMNDRSFVVTIAYIKTEAIQAAIFGLIFLGDRLTLPVLAAILIATFGVVVMSLKGKGTMSGGWQPVALGLFSGAMFALSAVGYRGAILSLDHPSFVLTATVTVTIGLIMQAGVLTLYLLARDRAVLTAIVRNWKPSLFAGFMGASASEFWFLAFAIATVASVRTLALIEVLFAQAISFFVFKQKTTAREALGMSLIVAGVVLLIWAQ